MQKRYSDLRLWPSSGRWRLWTSSNMYADISFEDMQNGVTGLYQ